MRESLIKTRPSRRGRIVGSLVLSVVFFVLIPTWLLGNLFVAVFPPMKSSSPAAASLNSSKQKTTTPINQSVQQQQTPTAMEIGANVNNSSDADAPVNTIAEKVDTHSTTPVETLPASAATNSKPEFRQWMNRKGQKVEAKFIRFNGDNIELITSDGKLAIVSPSIFSDEDQEYLKQLQR